jgi:hypothetical protein
MLGGGDWSWMLGAPLGEANWSWVLAFCSRTTGNIERRERSVTVRQFPVASQSAPL